MVAPLALLGIQAAASVVGAVGNAVAGKAQTVDAAKAAGLRKTADDFETMFLEQTLGQLTQSSGADGPLGDNGTNGIHRSMMVDQYAKQITKSGGVGISDQIYKQMLKMQEVG